ncbi:MAG: SDR family oxidoreductase [Chitinophagaceae bacterium]
MLYLAFIKRQKDMVAVISGASKGIGFAIAQKFVSLGMHVAICARNLAELQVAKERLQTFHADSCILIGAYDLTKQSESEEFARQVLDTFGAIDILVNNAGKFIPGDIISEPDGVLESLVETNLYSAYYLTRALLPSMLKRKKGHIFNISSVAALKEYEHGGSYSISKYALQGFSKNLRHELMSYDIKVTTINPGATYSDSWKGSGVAEDRIMKVEDIADTIWGVYQLSPQAVVEDIVLRPLKGDV